MANVRYRRDIDGLRSLAILPVLMFHLGLPPFTGGYVGVDVFFVISGYLITRSLQEDLRTGQFSLLRFYERRVRRIIPALFAMVSVVAVAGWLILLPDELRKLGTRMVAVMLFSSNILLWRQADYFAGPIEMDPLVHTWSLAVEEQFYIFFPLLLWACARRRRSCVPATALLAGLSFALSILFLWIDRTGDYYWLPTRAWELLVGALVAYGCLPPLKGQGMAEVVAAGGATLILASAILLTGTSAFPGYNALWPCLGAAALIHANTARQTVAGRLLGTPPLVGIGLISYSLYLVHWPLLVFVRYQLLREIVTIEKLELLTATLVLGFLSWKFIEQPFLRRRLKRRTLFESAAIVAALLGSAGAALFLLNGVPARFPGVRLPQSVDPTESESGPTCFMKDVGWDRWAGRACFLTRGPGPTTLLWGDSHANQYRDLIAQDSHAPLPNLLLYATAGCIPVLDIDVAGRPECRGNNDHVMDVLRTFHVRTVILSGSWQYTLTSSQLGLNTVARTATRLRAMGYRVRLLGDNPFYPFANPGYLAYRLSKRTNPGARFFVRPSNDWSFNRRLRDIAGQNDYFDPAKTLCRGADCLVYDKGRLVMRDTGHLSTFGRKLVYNRLRDFLAETRGQPASPNTAASRAVAAGSE
jgi:peptidoglycan/LPS O-acetylase OafA/YrhL